MTQIPKLPKRLARLSLFTALVVTSKLTTAQAAGFMCQNHFDSAKVPALQISYSSKVTPELEKQFSLIQSDITLITEKLKPFGFIAPDKVFATVTKKIVKGRDSSMGFKQILLTVSDNPQLVKLTHLVAFHEFGHLLFNRQLVKNYPALSRYYEIQDLNNLYGAAIQSVDLANDHYVALVRLDEIKKNLARAKENDDVIKINQLKDEYKKQVAAIYKIRAEQNRVETKAVPTEIIRMQTPKKERQIIEIVSTYSELFTDFLTELHFNSYSGSLTASYIQALGEKTSERSFAVNRDIPKNVSYVHTEIGYRQPHEMTGATRSYLWNFLKNEPAFAQNKLLMVKVLFEAITDELEFFTTNDSGIEFEFATTEFINSRLIESIQARAAQYN